MSENKEFFFPYFHECCSYHGENIVAEYLEGDSEWGHCWNAETGCEIDDPFDCCCACEPCRRHEKLRDEINFMWEMKVDCFSRLEDRIREQEKKIEDLKNEIERLKNQKK